MTSVHDLTYDTVPPAWHHKRSRQSGIKTIVGAPNHEWGKETLGGREGDSNPPASVTCGQWGK